MLGWPRFFSISLAGLVFKDSAPRVRVKTGPASCPNTTEEALGLAILEKLCVLLDGVLRTTSSSSELSKVPCWFCASLAKRLSFKSCFEVLP